MKKSTKSFISLEEASKHTNNMKNNKPHSFVFDNQYYYTIVEGHEEIPLIEQKFERVSNIAYYCDECKVYHIKPQYEKQWNEIKEEII